jgi:hypothetical protein
MYQDSGPLGLSGLLQQSEAGYGDYTAQRNQRLGSLTIRELVQEIEYRHRTVKDQTQHSAGN